MPNRPLEVIILDSLFRVHVRSESDPSKTYLVDLEANWGNGWCGCKNFEVECLPEFNKLAPQDRPRYSTENNAYRCKHIRVARRVCAPYIMDEFMKTKHEAELKLKRKSNP